MIELFIDGRAVEITPDCSVMLSAHLDELTAQGAVREKRFPLQLPVTPRNRQVLGFAEQILSPLLFNQTRHTGEVRCRGAVLIRGEAELVQCSTDPAGDGSYRLNLVVFPPKWITDANLRKLRDVPLPYETVVDGEAIRQSWTSGSPVRFLPVMRDRYTEEDGARVVFQELNREDYHPFVQIRALLERIIGASGYRIVSQFLDEPFFGTLYMSGNYTDGILPESGNRIGFSSLFAHDLPQIRLIEAIAHLFGLHFYTDEQTRSVYIEPRFTFLDTIPEIDWTDKIDPGKPVGLEESGAERYAVECFRYRNGDAAVERIDAQTGNHFGSWKATVDNRFARREEIERVNPLFTASRDEKGICPGAPDASIIVAGDRDARKKGLDFPLKIVRYPGMKELPAGQAWGWPSYGNSYPLTVFHSPEGDALSLCFGDEDGQLGLKNYYRSLYNALNRGKRLILYLNLIPSDVEAILYPNTTRRDFRGYFTFTLRGEKIRGRLIGIDGYDPGKGGSTRCTFSIEM